MSFLSTLIVFLLMTPQASTAQESLDLWYSIEPRLDCPSRYIARQMCIVTRAKDFTTEETTLLNDKLGRLEKLYPLFFSKIKAKKKRIEFFRHGFGANRLSHRTFKQNKNIGAWVTVGRKTVHLSDKFFKNETRINEQHDYIDYILIHELSHVIDMTYKNVSMTEDFLELYSWGKSPTGEVANRGGSKFDLFRWETQGVPYIRVDSIREEVVSLHNKGKNKEAENLSLSFGQSHGHPGSYSMLNPQENFAEIITAHFLDPDSLHTAPLSVKEWLNNFFKGSK